MRFKVTVRFFNDKLDYTDDFPVNALGELQAWEIARRYAKARCPKRHKYAILSVEEV
jgi:hypothetical protein